MHYGCSSWLLDQPQCYPAKNNKCNAIEFDTHHIAIIQTQPPHLFPLAKTGRNGYNVTCRYSYRCCVECSLIPHSPRSDLHSGLGCRTCYSCILYFTASIRPSSIAEIRDTGKNITSCFCQYLLCVNDSQLVPVTRFGALWWNYTVLLLNFFCSHPTQIDYKSNHFS